MKSTLPSNYLILPYPYALVFFIGSPFGLLPSSVSPLSLSINNQTPTAVKNFNPAPIHICPQIFNPLFIIQALEIAPVRTRKTDAIRRSLFGFQ